MKNYIRILYIFILMLLTLGFRVWYDGKWPISEDDPYLWIKLCDRTATISGEIPANDPFFTNSNNIVDIVQTVLDDVNSISSSYLTLEMYPEDPSNPPVGSHFTLDKEANRVIEICGVEKGGAAFMTESSGKLTKCTIEYGISTYHPDVKRFLNIIAHELGHCLNLAHPQEQQNAILSYYKKDTDEYRYLIDDKMGIVHLYPVRGLQLKEKATYGLSCTPQ